MDASLTLTAPAAGAALLGVALSFFLLGKSRRSAGGQPSASSQGRLRRKLREAGLGKASAAGKEGAPLLFELGELDVRRRWQIVVGGPTDHAGEVVIKPMPGFDLDKTIFGSLQGFLPRTVQKSKIGLDLYWSDGAVARVGGAFALLPPPPSYKKALVSFMQDDCDFSIEHADGSFMDHLKVSAGGG